MDGGSSGTKRIISHHIHFQICEVYIFYYIGGSNSNQTCTVELGVAMLWEFKHAMFSLWKFLFIANIFIRKEMSSFQASTISVNELELYGRSIDVFGLDMQLTW